jgi:hypothetical protein
MCEKEEIELKFLPSMEDSGEQFALSSLHNLLRENNALSTLHKLLRNRSGGGGSKPPSHSDSVIVNAKTTVHCSPGSIMLPFITLAWGSGTVQGARTFKCLWGSGIDTKE